MVESTSQNIIGDYEILELIGKGAQGDVYKAVCIARSNPNVAYGETVALKKGRAEAGEESSKDSRFIRQIEILKALRHPNIVRYRDSFVWRAGEWDEARCLVMELLDGEELKDVLDRHPRGLPWDLVRSVTEQSLDALRYACQRGYIHRDLKPHNIFLTKDGQVRLIDFGIARKSDGSATSTAGLKGSFDYMAPDWVRLGSTFSGDERSDIFSFGVVFFQVLTGKLPFPPLGDNAMIGYVQRWHANEGPRVKTDLPGLQVLNGAPTFIRTCLQASREERYPTFEQVLREFKKIERRVIRQEDSDEIYELLEFIGRGGFGEVFKAQRRSDSEIVALKRLTAVSQVDRFLREARVLQQYAHPHIVLFRDFVKGRLGTEEQHFLVLEYLDGMPEFTLRGRIRQSRSGMEVTEALELFVNYLKALHHLHHHGIIHRDIKPGNLYSPAGHPERAKIFDLGIARDISGTMTGGQVPGTPDYMAPEFARSGEDRGSAQSDLYSMGLCFYEALTGEPAQPRLADGPSGWMEFISRSQNPVVPSYAHPLFIAIPPLKAVTARALAWKPEQRFPSAEAMGAAIDAILNALVRGRETYYIDSTLRRDDIGTIARARRLRDGRLVLIRQAQADVSAKDFHERAGHLAQIQHKQLVTYLDHAWRAGERGRAHLSLVSDFEEPFYQFTPASVFPKPAALQTADLERLLSLFASLADLLLDLHGEGLRAALLSSECLCLTAADGVGFKWLDWGVAHAFEGSPGSSLEGRPSPIWELTRKADTRALAQALRGLIEGAPAPRSGREGLRKTLPLDARYPNLARLLASATSASAMEQLDPTAFAAALRDPEILRPAEGAPAPRDAERPPAAPPPAADDEAEAKTMALPTYADAMTTAVEAPPPPAQSPKPARAIPRWAMALAGVVVIGVVVAVVLSRRSPPPLPAPSRATVAATNPRTEPEVMAGKAADTAAAPPAKDLPARPAPAPATSPEQAAAAAAKAAKQAEAIKRAEADAARVADLHAELASLQTALETADGRGLSAVVGRLEALQPRCAKDREAESIAKDLAQFTATFGEMVPALAAEREPLDTRQERLQALRSTVERFATLFADPGKSLLATIDRQRERFVVRVANQSGKPAVLKSGAQQWGPISAGASHLLEFTAVENTNMILRIESGERGYLPQIKAVAVAPGGGAELVAGPFAVAPVSVRVNLPAVTEPGQPPVAGVRYAAKDAGAFSPMRSGEVLSLQPGVWRFQFVRPDYEPLTRELNLTAGEEAREVAGPEWREWKPKPARVAFEQTTDAWQRGDQQALQARFSAPAPAFEWPGHTAQYTNLYATWMQSQASAPANALPRANAQIRDYLAFLYQVADPAVDNRPRRFTERDRQPKLTFTPPDPSAAPEADAARLQIWADAAASLDERTLGDVADKLQTLGRQLLPRDAQAGQQCLFESVLLGWAQSGMGAVNTNWQVPEQYRWQAHIQYSPTDEGSLTTLDDLVRYHRAGGALDVYDLNLAMCQAGNLLNRFAVACQDAENTGLVPDGGRRPIPPEQALQRIYARHSRAARGMVQALGTLLADAPDAGTRQTLAYLKQHLDREEVVLALACVASTTTLASTGLGRSIQQDATLRPALDALANKTRYVAGMLAVPGR